MDGYGMVRNMIATNRSNLSRVGQRRSHKFESFDTSLFEPAFPTLHAFEDQTLTEECKIQMQQQQQQINKTLLRKDMIAGATAFLLTSTLATLFYLFLC